MSQIKAWICDCGGPIKHAYLKAGDFVSSPISSKYWGRELLKLASLFFPKEIIEALSKLLEELPLEEIEGPKEVPCAKSEIKGAISVKVQETDKD